MNRPYVIYHMMLSIDGKINGAFLSSEKAYDATEYYYKKNREYRGIEGNEKRIAKGFLCGRVTMQGSFTGTDMPDLSSYSGAKFDRSDYVANPQADFYAIAVDTKGKLNWKSNIIKDDDPGYDNCHVIEILCENVCDEYIAFLRDKNISYIFSGEDKLDLTVALDKLYRLFGIDVLLLEGGGIIGGTFAKENMIDELSFVTAPVIEGSSSQSVFAGEFLADCMNVFEPVEIDKTDSGTVWIRYIRK